MNEGDWKRGGEEEVREWRMEVIREVVWGVGRVVRLVVKVVEVVLVVGRGVVEVVRVGGEVGRVMWELLVEGEGVVEVVGGWMWGVGRWLRRRVEERR